MNNLDPISLLAGYDSVDVWTVDLDLKAERIGELEKSLSPDEGARADRFHALSDRRRFIAARGSLRSVLSQYLNIEPFQVRFAYTPDHKPLLAHPMPVAEEAFRFNVSHSDALALIAVSRGREVGIDLERLRTDFDPEALAKRFFSPEEYAALLRAPAEERYRVFLTYWVCKEAYLKALGTGLSRPLNTFTVSLEDYVIKAVSPGGPTIASYHLQPLSPNPEYVAAMAIEVS